MRGGPKAGWPHRPCLRRVLCRADPADTVPEPQRLAFAIPVEMDVSAPRSTPSEGVRVGCSCPRRREPRLCRRPPSRIRLLPKGLGHLRPARRHHPGLDPWGRTRWCAAIARRFERQPSCRACWTCCGGFLQTRSEPYTLEAPRELARVLLPRAWRSDGGPFFECYRSTSVEETRS